MATLQDNKLDPEQQEYEKNFDFARHERELQQPHSNGDDPSSKLSTINRPTVWSRDNRSIAEREAAPSWDTNIGNSGGGGEKPRPGRFSLQQMLKKRVNQWILGGLITFIIGIVVAIPATLSGALVHMKELASDWGNKNNNSFFSKRTSKYLKDKLFQADKNCTGGVECRFKTGISDKEIEEMKKAGLNPEVGQDGDKKFIKSFSTTDVAGNPVKVTAANFEEHYSNNVNFRAQMDGIAKPKTMLMLGKATIDGVFNKFGINKNRTVSGADEQEREKNFRADEYSSGNQTERVNAAPTDPNNPNGTQQIAGVDQSIQDAANAERAALESSGFDHPPTIVPDVTNLDLNPSESVKVAEGLVKGGLKGAILGVFSVIDKACSGYQLLRAVVFGAKVYKALALIKYAGIFMTLADKLKAGDAKPDEIAFVAGLLFKPSAAKDSYGKTFFQSEGFNLIFQGKIADHRGLARYTTGTPFLQFFQGAEQAFQRAGANKDSCKQVKSWYGQTFLTIAGLVTDIFSGGTLSVGGVVAGVAVGMIVSILVAYVTPLLIQYAAGTVAPDVSDIEGGYGVGNAIGAGIGAFGEFTGKTNGERILTTADATSVEMESNKEMAFENKVDNYGKSPFSLSSDTSIPTQLALAVAPMASSPLSQNAFQSLASIVTSPFSLFSSSLSKIVTGGVDAQNDIDRGGQYCADDDYNQMGIAVDAFCNPIPGEKTSTIDDPKYDPEAVLKYMIDNKHIDPQTGDAVSADFQKYNDSCTNSVDPISPDGGAADVGSNIDTRWCIDPSEEFTMFRMYIADSSIDTDHNDSVNGTLGQDSGGGSTTTGSTTNTYPNGMLPDSALCALGAQWPGQKVLCGVDDKFAALNNAFKQQFGTDMIVKDSYLTLDQQKQCKGATCATPGSSQNGCGVAIDFGGDVAKVGTAEYTWVEANAVMYGWIEPDWASQGGSKPDPGHWEYGTNGLPNGGTCTV